MTAYVKSGSGSSSADDPAAVRKTSLATTSLPTMTQVSSVAAPVTLAASPSPESKSRRRGSHQRSESLGGGFVQQVSALGSLAPRSPSLFEGSGSSGSISRGSHRVLPSKPFSAAPPVSATSTAPITPAQILSPSPVLAHKTEEVKNDIASSPVMRSSGGRARSLSRADLDHVVHFCSPSSFFLIHRTKKASSCDGGVWDWVE